MGKFVLNDAYVSINGVDLSDHVRSVTLNYSAAEIDVTCMGDGSINRIAGLKDWSAEIEFAQDFAASEVDATLFSLVGAASFPVAIRPTSAAVSATNPEFQGNAILTSYPPISGAVGELATTTITLMGDGDLTRATA